MSLKKMFNNLGESFCAYFENLLDELYFKMQVGWKFLRLKIWFCFQRRIMGKTSITFSDDHQNQVSLFVKNNKSVSNICLDFRNLSFLRNLDFEMILTKKKPIAVKKKTSTILCKRRHCHKDSLMLHCSLWTQHNWKESCLPVANIIITLSWSHSSRYRLHFRF